MERDQAKRYLKEYGEGLETTDSSLTPVLYYWLFVVKVDRTQTQTPPSTIYLH